MTEPARIRLSRLRAIGWSLWDPIGLASFGSEGDGSAADEYDGYLLHVAGQLRRHAGEEECIRYLMKCEAEHMGLGFREGALTRARRTVDAISKYLAELNATRP